MENDNLSIRRVNKSEIRKLQEIAITTFLDAYSPLNTASNMEAYVAKNLSLSTLTQELANPESQFYFAEKGGEVIGYMKLNIGDAQTEPDTEGSLEIERIYVLAEYQRNRAGLWMLKKAIEFARSKKLTSIWLGVWEKNPKAISFYKKNGFEEFGRHIFKFGNEDQTDLMMKINL